MELGFVSDWLNDGFKHGKTPLIQSCRNLDFDLAKGLINLGADLKKQDDYGSTPLIEIIINGIGTEKQKLGMVKLLIDVMDKADIKQTNFSNQTALIAAASRNYLDVVKVLIDIDPQDPDLLNEDDNYEDFVDVLERLGNRGWLRENYPVIDSRKQWKDDAKPLNNFILPTQPSIIDFINADYGGGGQTLLIQACQNSDLNSVRKLIKAGADANKADNKGNTPLIYAAKLNHYDLVVELVNVLKPDVFHLNSEEKDFYDYLEMQKIKDKVHEIIENFHDARKRYRDANKFGI